MISSSTTRVVRRREYRETPWRNGGGVTFEIAREPQNADAFDWRLSLARLDRDGPFSDFSGYQRALTLLQGAGCNLYGLGARPKVLNEIGATVLFSGAAAVSCELISGPCSDLNLMVREPGQIVSVEHFALLAHETESLRPACENAVFCLDGDVECLHMRSGERVTLAAQDTLIVAAPDAGDWRLLRGEAGRAHVVVHTWRAHNDR
ncbi:MAG: HutD/Ves family protein [Steroidobacter sp.]